MCSRYVSRFREILVSRTGKATIIVARDKIEEMTPEMGRLLYLNLTLVISGWVGKILENNHIENT